MLSSGLYHHKGNHKSSHRGPFRPLFTGYFQSWIPEPGYPKVQKAKKNPEAHRGPRGLEKMKDLGVQTPNYHPGRGQ